MAESPPIILSLPQIAIRNSKYNVISNYLMALESYQKQVESRDSWHLEERNGTMVYSLHLLKNKNFFSVKIGISEWQLFLT